jgi:hypothetical protein
VLQSIHPKLPMRHKAATRSFYIDQLGFEDIGRIDYPGYLMIRKDEIEIHFFEFAELDPKENYGQVYIRTSDIRSLYEWMVSKNIRCTALETKPWRQVEFATWDPDHNLLTFGESI